MNWNNLLPCLADRSHILVTGPQRSGTTIAARILAEELGRPLVLEERIGIDDLGAYFRLREREPAFVLQAPALCFICHRLDAAVVLMRRNPEAIRASEQRIGWRHEGEELARYFRTRDEIARVKYDAWDRFQKQKCCGFELDYDSLASHPLWVPPQKRRRFAPRQTA